MTVLQVPEDDGVVWPSLGGQVCRWIEENLVFGPGDLRGEPARLDDEKRALIWRMYEVWPENSATAGRRRFRRCCWSAQKGSAKTELAAWIAAVELHPDGPVRTAGWRSGRPIGGGVTDPYIPMVAYTEEQTEDLAYGALKAILENSRVAGAFDIGLERIMRRTGDGKAVALASSPNARDGARTTFAHKDETHRWVLPSLKRAHQTMLANLPKRFAAQPWELETTTAFSPGEGSVAEATMEYAKAVAEGRISDSSLFFYHRQASDHHDIRTPAGLRAAVVEACGPTEPWRDVDGIIAQWQDPNADPVYLERVWLNRPTQTSAQAFDTEAWKRNSKDVPEWKAPGRLITLGFDGSLSNDATALIVRDVETGYGWPVGIWERPVTHAGYWEVDKAEVSAMVDFAFTTWNVWRMYADPSKWEGELALWAGRYGAERVVAFSTTFYKRVALALKAFAGAIRSGEATNDGDAVHARHIGNALKNPLNFVDDDGERLWLIQKDRPGSPNKIDAGMADALAWQARLDAITAGALNVKSKMVGVSWV